MASCFIAKSDKAIAVVPAEQRKELPEDSEQFITYLVTHVPKLLPICELLDDKALALLPYAFYKQSHLRHMLDMEGGYNMISSLVSAIREQKITAEQYNTWFARWIINIAGLDGHIHYEGSSYLSEPVANCIWALKHELDKLWADPSHNVIDSYLQFREQQLQQKGTYIAYLAALMREYSPSKGLQIATWFNKLSAAEQEKYLTTFKTQMEQTKVTPTYKPTVLANLLQLGCSISEALSIFTEIEHQALTEYAQAIKEGKMVETQVLSFRKIAFEESLTPLVTYYKKNQCLPEVHIDAQGNCVMNCSYDTAPHP